MINEFLYMLCQYEYEYTIQHRLLFGLCCKTELSFPSRAHPMFDFVGFMLLLILHLFKTKLQHFQHRSSTVPDSEISVNMICEKRSSVFVVFVKLLQSTHETTHQRHRHLYSCTDISNAAYFSRMAFHQSPCATSLQKKSALRFAEEPDHNTHQEEGCIHLPLGTHTHTQTHITDACLHRTTHMCGGGVLSVCLHSRDVHCARCVAAQSTEPAMPPHSNADDH